MDPEAVATQVRPSSAHIVLHVCEGGGGGGGVGGGRGCGGGGVGGGLRVHEHTRLHTLSQMCATRLHTFHTRSTHVHTVQEEVYNPAGLLVETEPCGVHECSTACTAQRCKQNMRVRSETFLVGFRILVGFRLLVGFRFGRNSQRSRPAIGPT